MKTLVLSVWVFINLLLFGMLGYMFLLWSQHWHAVSQKQQLEAPSEDLQESQAVEYYNEDIKHFAALLDKSRIKKRSKPPLLRFLKDNIATPDPPIGNNSLDRIEAHKNALILRLRRVLYSESNVFKFKASNPYNVNYKGSYGNQQNSVSRQQLLCSLKHKIPFLKTLRKDDIPPENELYEFLPKNYVLDSGKRYKNCAIVSNAGSLKHSKSGYFIENHDLVLRFNHAPTDVFSEDVGKKTNIRIVNSRVVTNPNFEFVSSSLFQNVTLLVWDPCNYSSSLSQWLDSPEHPFFESFIKHRKLYPETEAYILNPMQLWILYDFLQAHTSVRLRPNPPSSGLLGLALLLPHCDVINMFEFVPSLRLTEQCHYFEPELDEHCTFGVWHPLAAEKFFFINVNSASDSATYQDGYVSIPGYPSLNCN